MAVSYTQNQSLLPETPIKVAPWAQDSFTTSPPPTRLTNRTPQVAHIMAAGSFRPPSGVTEPPASHIPARLESSFTQPQQKRKRDVGAGNGDETGEERLPVHKRRSRGARFQTPQQSDARKRKVNKHEQSPIQPQPRRSTRIQERNKETAPPKAESLAKPASRKPAVRKK